MSLLTYHVRGRLLDAHTGRPMIGYAIVAESGVRDEASPLSLHGIKAGRRDSDELGCFSATFFTTGASLDGESAAPVPLLVEVHIEFNPGKWRCRPVEVSPEMLVSLVGRQVELDLGEIPVDHELCRPPRGGS